LDSCNEARKPIESQGSVGFRRAWLNLSAGDKAIALTALLLAAAIGALGTAVLQRAARHAATPAPAALELRGAQR
jgi:hypothetical protein